MQELLCARITNLNRLIIRISICDKFADLRHMQFCSDFGNPLAKISVRECRQPIVDSSFATIYTSTVRSVFAEL